ncbi:MAG: hypothetical protein H0Z33_13965 [Bacillaceae bacterium]|nr:hypothetical protein [Bacillaceae bacterium]
MGSGGFSSFGGFGGGTGKTVNRCGEKVTILLIVNENQKAVWRNVSVNDEVSIILRNDDTLPVMEVKKEKDNFSIGVVPPKYSWLLKCIEEGWEYKGVVIKKEGNQHDPKVTVEVEA